MTLVEIIVATGILSFVIATSLGSFMTARRLTEATIFKSAATAAVQGYLEQIKNMDYALVYTSPVAGTSMSGNYSTTATNFISTQADEVTTDNLVLSPLPRLSSSSVTVGTVPSAVYDNVKTFTVTRTNDLTIHIWVWVEDMTPSGVTPTQQVKGITLLYMTEYSDGATKRYEVSSLRTFRSQVPTF